MPQVEPKPRVREDRAVKAPPETMHDREEVGQEVASDLTIGGMGAFLSAAAKGVNLLATSAALTASIPVRVVTDPEGKRLKLKHDDAKLLSDTDGVVAFLLGEPDERDRYYLPIAAFLAKATLRDGRHSLDFDAHETWLRAYLGHAGVKKAFARLVRKAPQKPGAGA
ncbi:MAG TPA: hypothetical protein VH092_32900 [Urbifossiella sp.]|jgi:hypothetical protein|nr:hypothetical protein [Urbifossiella sp.]